MYQYDQYLQCRGRVLIYPCFLIQYKGVYIAIQHIKEKLGIWHYGIYSLVRLYTYLSRCTGFLAVSQIMASELVCTGMYWYIHVLLPFYGVSP